MKYLITLLTFCFLTSLSAQEGTIFKHRFKSNAHYLTAMNMKASMDMDMDVPEDMKPQMPEQMDSMKMYMDMFFGMSVKTGEEQDGKVPFVMTYDSIMSKMNTNGNEVDLSDQQMSMFNGMEIKGHFTDKEMLIDSIFGMAATEEMKGSMRTQMQGVQLLLDFPDKPMMIGDTFSQVNLNEVSTAAGAIGIEVLLTLKLERIDGNLATFSTTEVYDFSKTNAAPVKMTGDGSGGGILIFNIEKQHVVSYDNKSIMNINMDMSSQVGADMKMDIGSNNHIIITTELKE